MNWFNTLNEALESENFSYTYDDGTKYGRYITIYRDNTGRYERPIHYAR